jgi:hypothetical protein
MWSLSVDPAQLEKSIAQCGAERAGEVYTPFSPVKAGDRKGALALLNRREVDPKIAEKGLAVPRHEERSVAELQATGSDERFGESDAETAREVVVARTGGSETFRRCRGTKGGYGSSGRDRREGFHRVRDLAARQPIAPLSALTLHADEPSIDQRLKVGARRRERYARRGGQRPGGHRPAVEQALEDRGTGPIPDSSSGEGDVGFEFHTSMILEVLRRYPRQCRAKGGSYADRATKRRRSPPRGCHQRDGG